MSGGADHLAFAQDDVYQGDRGSVGPEDLKGPEGPQGLKGDEGSDGPEGAGEEQLE